MSMIEESRDWLLDRLPEPLRHSAWGGRMPGTRLEWRRPDGRWCDMLWLSPHRVHCIAANNDASGWRQATYLVAMNLYEIIDMVRWAVEGR